MDERGWGRVAAVAGLLFAAMILLRTLVVPVPPWVGGQAGVQRFFAEKHGLLGFGVFATGVIVVLGTFFFGGLRAFLVRQSTVTPANIMFGGWLIQGALALARHTFVAIPALIPAAAPSSAVGLYTLASVMLGFVWFSALIITAAVGLVPNRSGALPAWFSWLTLVAAVIFLLGGLAVSTPAGFFSRSGDFRWVVLYTYIGWSAIAALVLYQRVGAEAPGA